MHEAVVVNYEDEHGENGERWKGCFWGVDEEKWQVWPALLTSLLVYTCRLDGAFPRESLMHQELSPAPWDPSLRHTETAHTLLPTEPPRMRSQRGGKPGQVAGRPDRASEWPPKSWPPRNMAE